MTNSSPLSVQSGKAAEAASAAAGILLPSAFGLFFSLLFFLPAPISFAAIVPAAEGIASGTEHSCSVLTDGTVKCWGADWGGQQGNGSGTTNQFSPLAVSSLTDVGSIGYGMYHACAVLGTGTAKCWGSNWSGQLGDGTYAQKDTPVSVGSLTGAVRIVGGSDHSCALLSSGGIKCWGGNDDGQLGNGTTTSSSTPVSVSGISTAIDITAGEFHTCAILTGGTAKCWGDNTHGQLGDGTATDRTSPVSVSGITTASDITAGSYHGCAVLTSGAAKCWGNNAAGQLGNNTLTSSLTPVSVSGLTGAAKISAALTYSASDAHTCAVLSSGAAKCWGDNLYGQLGSGTTTDSKVPVTVSGLSGASDITASFAHTCALKSDKTAFCWGDDYLGYLGDGTGDSSSLTPVQVVNLTVDDGGGSGGSGGESLWEQAGSAIYYLLGNVGIGTSSPQEKLDVNGNLRLTGDILPGGDVCIGECE